MFTGLIQEVGTIAALERHGLRVVVAAPSASRTLRIGDSVAVSGVCLTAVKIDAGESFAADLAQETLQRTSLSRIAVGARVNLELPMRSGDPLGGHIVQGHVDGVGQFLSLTKAGNHVAGTPRRHRIRKPKVTAQSDWWLRLQVPAELTRYVVEKGSITIEGISLTVARVEGTEVTIAIIPHTYSATNLDSLRPGDAVNIEVDVLAKYAEKMTQAKPSSRITVERLQREGF